MFGRNRPASDTQFKWRIAGPLIVVQNVFGSSLPHQLKKTVVKGGPPLKKNCFDPRMHDICNLVFIAYESSGCSDETAHLRSLVKAQTTRTHNVGTSMKA